ncbi:MAG TPA: hypothetical protein VJA94_18300 [Candidatus Angelobacter sp.]
MPDILQEPDRELLFAATFTGCVNANDYTRLKRFEEVEAKGC